MDNDALRTLVDAALALHVDGDLHGALACYLEALDIEPANTLVLYNVGCLFEEAGFEDWASELFQAAAKTAAAHSLLDPDIIRAAREYGKRGIN